MNLKRPTIEIVSNTSEPAKATETLDPIAGNPFAIVRERLRLSQPELAPKTEHVPFTPWSDGSVATRLQAPKS